MKKIATIFVFLLYSIALPICVKGSPLKDADRTTILINKGIDYSDFIGTWKGKIEIGDKPLNILFHIGLGEDGKPSCTLDSPDQGAKGIPAEIQIFPSDSISIDIDYIGAYYQGRKIRNDIVGTFSQGAYSFDLHLIPGELIRRRPQTPIAPFPYQTEEITFSNEDGQATLAGTLTYPIGYDKSRGHDTPIVLMITGSGLQNRDEEIFEHKPFAVIADYLARNGIASLRYDDRSYGSSTGETRNSTSLDFKEDALAGIRYLRDLKKFGEIGIIGHSEGGSIAFMLAHQRKIDFLVSMAAPGIRGDKILIEQNRNMLINNGIPKEEADNYCLLLKDVLEEKINNGIHHEAEDFVSSLLIKRGIVISYEMRANLIAFIQMETPWLDHFIAYDPHKDISGCRCPIMAINGEKDTQIKATENLNAIKNSLHHQDNHLIKIYPGLNHLFQHCQSGHTMEYANIEETISEEVLNDIVQWILKITAPK